MKPLKNFVCVTQPAAEQTTESGILLTGAGIQSGSKPARVEAIGPDVIDVKVGDTIAIKWDEALPITLKNGDYAALISEDSIYGIY
jgi:co-chaperonin GroES (HSP10)